MARVHHSKEMMCTGGSCWDGRNNRGWGDISGRDRRSGHLGLILGGRLRRSCDGNGTAIITEAGHERSTARHHDLRSAVVLLVDSGGDRLVAEIQGLRTRGDKTISNEDHVQLAGFSRDG